VGAGNRAMARWPNFHYWICAVLILLSRPLVAEL
jgi:hypothetical protein